MSSLLIEIHHIHKCLKIICDVEAEILDSSLLGLFKKKNFAGNEQMLDVVCRKLAELHTSVDKYLGSSNGIDCVICDSQDYIHALLLSTSKLIEINRGLAANVSGKHYSMTSYKQDLKLFKILQGQYSVIGNRMNANFRLYSNEINELG